MLGDSILDTQPAADAGIPEHWIVDLDARMVERWRLGDERPEILSEVLRWQPDPTIPPLEIRLPSLFNEVLGSLLK